MRRRRTAHRFGDRRRTTDVLTEETLDFSGLMLSSTVLEGLRSAGFERPSPIQLKAIPLGRCGLDLIAQAKSGTGKTCVFSVIALENINLAVASVQVLVLAPTREIAAQIKDVVCSIGRHMEGLHVHVFIGGMPVEEDKRRLKQCHVAVGTPGRVKYLIENKFLKPDSIRLFILDEADKLLDDSFQSQINWIFSTLPSSKQMLALSATYTDHLAQHLKNYMKDPTFVRLNAVDPALEGIRHYRLVVPYHSLPHQVFQEKVKTLLILLSKLPFHQCLIFSNYQIRARNLSETLSKNGWPSTYISGSQEQNERLKAMEKLKEFKCRILISTDLTSRGIDAERVNLVINMDIPRDSQTYLHRVGRAGRFGSYGAAVNFVAEGKEVASLHEIEAGCGVVIGPLPEDISQLLSEPGVCKQPISNLTTNIGSLESEVSQLCEVTGEFADEKCVNKEEIGPVDGGEAGGFEVVHEDKLEMAVDAGVEVVGPVDGGNSERNGGFEVAHGDKIETEGNAVADISEKKEAVEIQTFRSDFEEHNTSVVSEEKKEKFKNRASADQRVHEHVHEEKPGINKGIDKASDDRKDISDTKLGYTQAGGIGEYHISHSRIWAGKPNQINESSCSAVPDEKTMNKEFRENLGCYMGNLGSRRGQNKCLLEKNRNGEHAKECFSNRKALGGRREDEGHLRGHCGTEELLGECRDTKELLVERLETKEDFGEHATEEDNGERFHNKEHLEGRFEKPTHLGEPCGTEEHLGDNRDNKEHLEELCDNNKHLKMDCTSEFSEDICGSEDVLEEIRDGEELHRREFAMPLEKPSKAEFSPTQNGTAGRFCEETCYASPFKNQLCDDSIVEKQLCRENGGFTQVSLDCGVQPGGQDYTKLENSVAFYGESFDSISVKKNSVIFRQTQTPGPSFGIESVWVPPGSGGTESACSEEYESKNSCFVAPRSQSSCSKETGPERSCSEESGSDGSCSEENASDGSCSSETGSEGSCSEETGSESFDIESLNDLKSVPISGEDFDNVLESYIQNRASGKPSTVQTRSEEVSKCDVATESRTLIGSQSKVTGKSDGPAAEMPPIVIDKPHGRQSCTESDQDGNDVIKTHHHLSRDADGAAWESGRDLDGSQGTGQGVEDATFHGASANDVTGYMSALPDEWKRVWYEAYERQTKLISSYAKVYHDAFN